MTERRPHSRHGIHSLKARVMARGLATMDQRTAAAQDPLTWRKDLLDDLGDEAAVSAAQLALFEAATRTKLYVDHVDAVLLERAYLTTKHRNRLIPLVEQQRIPDRPRAIGPMLPPQPKSEGRCAICHTPSDSVDREWYCELVGEGSTSGPSRSARGAGSGARAAAGLGGTKRGGARAPRSGPSPRGPSRGARRLATVSRALGPPRINPEVRRHLPPVRAGASPAPLGNVHLDREDVALHRRL
jgi:hypothetical protein